MKQSTWRQFVAGVANFIRSGFDKICAKLASKPEKVDKKDDYRYQEKIDEAVRLEHDNYTPQSEKELVQTIRRTPREVLSVRDRNLISGAMSFAKRKAILVMMPREDITFLNDSDFLGPVNLDKLYKTGDTIFPVLDKSKKVCGLIRTDKLDLLHITKDQPVTKLMEHEIAFARDDYTLEQLLAVFLRSHTDYVLIIDKKEQLLGYAELRTLIAILFNREIKDDFENDSSSIAVSRRELE